MWIIYFVLYLCRQWNNFKRVFNSECSMTTLKSRVFQVQSLFILWLWIIFFCRLSIMTRIYFFLLLIWYSSSRDKHCSHCQGHNDNTPFRFSECSVFAPLISESIHTKSRLLIFFCVKTVTKLKMFLT